MALLVCIGVDKSEEGVDVGSWALVLRMAR